MNINNRKTKLIEKLKNKEYRDSFVYSGINVGIAFQIKELRKQLHYTQEELAEIANMKQERISALENINNAPNISTLIRLANSLDIGLLVRFVSIGELVERYLKLSPESFEIPSFNEDPYFNETTGEGLGLQLAAAKLISQSKQSPDEPSTDQQSGQPLDFMKKLKKHQEEIKYFPQKRKDPSQQQLMGGVEL